MSTHADTAGERLIYEGAIINWIDETIYCMLNHDIPKSRGMDDARLRFGNLEYLVYTWPICAAVNLAVEIVKIRSQMFLKLKRRPFTTFALASIKKRLI